MIDLNELTDRLWANKQAKGFNTTDIEREFNFTYGELAEAYESYRKDKGDIDEELADVVIYVLSLARMQGIDLEAALLKKMDKNERREYTKVNGRHVRTKEADGEPPAAPINTPRPRLNRLEQGGHHD